MAAMETFIPGMRTGSFARQFSRCFGAWDSPRFDGFGEQSSIRSGGGLEVELAFAFLIEDAIGSGAAAAHVHPVAGHHYD